MQYNWGKRQCYNWFDGLKSAWETNLKTGEETAGW